MNALTPLESLYEVESGAESRELSLPPDLVTLYGRLLFPAFAHRLLLFETGEQPDMNVKELSA
jgi:hypothetical protein